MIASKTTRIHPSGSKSSYPCTSRQNHAPTMNQRPNSRFSTILSSYITHARRKLPQYETGCNHPKRSANTRQMRPQLIRHMGTHRPSQDSHSRSSTQHQQCSVKVALTQSVAAQFHALTLSNCPNRQSSRNQWERGRQTPGNKGKTQVSNAAPKRHTIHAYPRIR